MSSVQFKIQIQRFDDGNSTETYVAVVEQDGRANPNFSLGHTIAKIIEFIAQSDSGNNPSWEGGLLAECIFCIRARGDTMVDELRKSVVVIQEKMKTDDDLTGAAP